MLVVKKYYSESHEAIMRMPWITFLFYLIHIGVDVEKQKQKQKEDAWLQKAHAQRDRL